MAACECGCHSTVVHLKAEVEALTLRVERLTRDVARESVDRQADVRLLRRNLAEFGGSL